MPWWRDEDLRLIQTNLREADAAAEPLSGEWSARVEGAVVVLEELGDYAAVVVSPR